VRVSTAQYREASSDLTEALGFIKTVHADELTGYDGDSVRHIVDTLRASRPHLYPSALDLFTYNATPPHNGSLSVPIRSPGNDSDRRIPAERAGAVVSRSDADVLDGGGADRGPAERGRREVERVVEELTPASTKYSTPRHGGRVVADGANETVVVAGDVDDVEMTSGRGGGFDDVDEDRQPADADVEVLADRLTRTSKFSQPADADVEVLADRLTRTSKSLQPADADIEVLAAC